MDFPKIDDFPDTEPDQLNSRFQTNDVRAEVVDELTREAALNVVAAKFPRLLQRITLLWGSQELQDTFSKWLVTDTHDRFGNPRRGFPADVQEALMTLAVQHSDRFKFEANTDFAPWPDRW